METTHVISEVLRTPEFNRRYDKPSNDRAPRFWYFERYGTIVTTMIHTTVYQHHHALQF